MEGGGDGVDGGVGEEATQGGVADGLAERCVIDVLGEVVVGGASTEGGREEASSEATGFRGVSSACTSFRGVCSDRRGFRGVSSRDKFSSDASSECEIWSSERKFSGDASSADDKESASNGDGMGDVIVGAGPDDVAIGGGVDRTAATREALLVVGKLSGQPIRVKVMSSSITPAQSFLAGRR